MPEHAQLFERFNTLQRRSGQGRIYLQEFVGVGIQADMPQRRELVPMLLGQPLFRLRKTVAMRTSALICAAVAAIRPGSINGSSPCTLTTTASSARSSDAATSAMRSVPDG